MPAKQVKITVMDKSGTYSERTMPMGKVKAFRQDMSERGVTLISSRPVRA